jgi:rRNA maturation protein Nop10
MFHVKQFIKMKKLEACPICGNNATASYMHCTDAMKSKETFTLNQCEECGFTFTNPRPDTKRLAK